MTAPDPHENWEGYLAQRHPAMQQVARWFDYGHLPEGKPRSVSAQVAALAIEIIPLLSDGPELTTGLRKLLEAKDCFVRQAIADTETHGKR